jgi:uncharacterized protein (TIGR00725 family)
MNVPRNSLVKVVGVIGAGQPDARLRELAFEVGERLARAGLIVVTGGLGGVMEGASAGAASAGGVVVGILPGPSAAEANSHVQVPIATGMGEARNAVLVNSSAGVIAIGGEYGTLSEIAFALKAGKPVVALDSWDLDERIVRAGSPAEAVHALLERLGPAGAGDPGGG